MWLSYPVRTQSFNSNGSAHPSSAHMTKVTHNFVRLRSPNSGTPSKYIRLIKYLFWQIKKGPRVFHRSRSEPLTKYKFSVVFTHMADRTRLPLATDSTAGKLSQAICSNNNVLISTAIPSAKEETSSSCCSDCDNAIVYGSFLPVFYLTRLHMRIIFLLVFILTITLCYISNYLSVLHDWYMISRSEQTIQPNLVDNRKFHLHQPRFISICCFAIYSVFVNVRAVVTQLKAAYFRNNTRKKLQTCSIPCAIFTKPWTNWLLTFPIIAKRFEGKHL